MLGLIEGQGTGVAGVVEPNYIQSGPARRWPPPPQRRAPAGGNLWRAAGTNVDREADQVGDVMKFPEELKIPAIVFTLEAAMLAGFMLIFLVLVPR